jgi:hypothetical protein
MVDRFEEMRQDVIQFNRKHPDVWRLFCGFTFDMINRGFMNYSVNAIFERIRWEIDAGGDGVTSFKLNNNYRAFYARAFMRKYPRARWIFSDKGAEESGSGTSKSARTNAITLSLRYNHEQYQTFTITRPANRRRAAHCHPQCRARRTSSGRC